MIWSAFKPVLSCCTAHQPRKRTSQQSAIWSVFTRLVRALQMSAHRSTAAQTADMIEGRLWANSRHRNDRVIQPIFNDVLHDPKCPRWDPEFDPSSLNRDAPQFPLRHVRRSTGQLRNVRLHFHRHCALTDRRCCLLYPAKTDESLLTRQRVSLPL